MNLLEKYMLLVSLSFFFGCLIIALTGLYDDPRPKNSYMYSPPQLDTSQTQPIKEASRQYTSLPQSVLHYPGTEDLNKDKTILCYLEEDYKNLVRKIIDEDSAKLVARGTMKQNEMEIYAVKNGKFSVFVIGSDAIGQKEACEVSKGKDWKVIEP